MVESHLVYKRLERPIKISFGIFWVFLTRIDPNRPAFVAFLLGFGSFLLWMLKFVPKNDYVRSILEL